RDYKVTGVQTCALPISKLKPAVGLIPRVRVAAIPVPLRATEVGEVGTLLTMEMLPDAGPVAVGRNVDVIVVCCPAVTFTGNEYRSEERRVGKEWRVRWG